MKRVGLLLLLAASVLFISACNTSDQDTRETVLTTEEEVTPPTLGDATPTGTVTAILSADQDTLTISGRFEGLTGAAQAGHIHLGNQGEDGPVICDLSVDEATEGEVRGTCAVEKDVADPTQKGPIDYDRYVNGEDYYVNIHTEANPGGELRGQLD